MEEMPSNQDHSEKSHHTKTKSITFASGIATVRSSTHRLRPSKTRDQDPGPKSSIQEKLPSSLKQKSIFPYDAQKYNLRNEVKRMLSQDCVTELIGSWENENGFEKGLEYFVVLQKAVLKGTSKKARASLSDIVQNDTQFCEVFDSFVQTFILPTLKERLIQCGVVTNESEKTTFYYQRPPTIRIQPGPSSQVVPEHCDSEYGHQDGELNFWIPLTDKNLTQTDLYVESIPNKNDYTPLDVNFGQVALFHGTSLRHYVPPNTTRFTRVSLDFRVGIEGYFDTKWQMRGTLDDHNRAVFVV